MSKATEIISYASDFAANIRGAAKAPEAIKQACGTTSKHLHWQTPITPDNSITDPFIRTQKMCQASAKAVENSILNKTRFIVLGGDHSCAIGTWQGAVNAIDGDLGLIWIDAHLDAHTPESTLTGNIHGMPVATLLGKGSNTLTQLTNTIPALKPKNIILIGIRSFEKAEYNLLTQLGVRIVTDEQVQQVGIHTVMEDARAYIINHSSKFGISIDIDGFSPTQAPGVSTPEKGGIDTAAFMETLNALTTDPHFVGAEIAEFNPAQDKRNQTLQLCCQLVQKLS